MNHQLVFSDIDGTLLNDEKALLPSTDMTIRKLVKSGVLFATVSARTISHTYDALSTLSEVCCANAYVNGAFIETYDGEVLVDSPIEDDEAYLLVEIFDNFQASFSCISKNDAIATVRHPEIIRAFEKHHGRFTETSLTNSPGFKPYLIAVIMEDIQPVIEVINKQLPGIETSPVVRPQAYGRGTEGSFIQKRGTNKGAALRRIAEYYNVDLSRTVAIGDSIINDGPMIEAAGYGVAMKNSHNAIIDKAKYVTEKDNNEDGVGKFLCDLFGL